MFDDLDDWLDGLAAEPGIASATVDPATLRTPGVWCRVVGFGQDVLAAGDSRLDLELYLAVSDADWLRARDALMALYATVSSYLRGVPIPEVRFVRLALPDGNDLPALSFPYTLRITD